MFHRHLSHTKRRVRPCCQELSFALAGIAVLCVGCSPASGSRDAKTSENDREDASLAATDGAIVGQADASSGANDSSVSTPERDGSVTGGSDGGGGNGGTTDKRLFPLEAGMTWTYSVTAQGAYSPCTSGMHTSSVLGSSQLAGKKAFEVSSFCKGIGSSMMTAEGDKTLVYYADNWQTFLDAPVQAGHTWTFVNASYTWQEIATVKVPAGTFEDCFMAKQNVAYTAEQTYCRGVGLVRSVSIDLSGTGWDAQLASRK